MAGRSPSRGRGGAMGPAAGVEPCFASELAWPEGWRRPGWRLVVRTSGASHVVSKLAPQASSPGHGLDDGARISWLVPISMPRPAAAQTVSTPIIAHHLTRRKPATEVPVHAALPPQHKLGRKQSLQDGRPGGLGNRCRLRQFGDVDQVELGAPSDDQAQAGG